MAEYFACSVIENCSLFTWKSLGKSHWSYWGQLFLTGANIMNSFYICVFQVFHFNYFILITYF